MYGKVMDRHLQYHRTWEEIKAVFVLVGFFFCTNVAELTTGGRGGESP